MRKERSIHDFDEIPDDEGFEWRKPQADSRIRIDRSWLTPENVAVAARKRELAAAVSTDETLRQTVDLLSTQIAYDALRLQEGIEESSEVRQRRWKEAVYDNLPAAVSQERRAAIAGIGQAVEDAADIAFAMQSVTHIPAGDAFLEDPFFSPGFIDDSHAAFLLVCMADSRTYADTTDDLNFGQYADTLVRDLGLGANRLDPNLRSVTLSQVITAALVPQTSHVLTQPS